MSWILCRCNRHYPLHPNLTVRRAAGLRLASMTCPWCSLVVTIRIDRMLWERWRCELADWDETFAGEASRMGSWVEEHRHG